MIRLDIQEYCHGCPHFDPKKDATYARDQWGETIAIDNRVWCYNSVRCEAIARYLRRKLAEEKKDDSNPDVQRVP